MGEQQLVHLSVKRPFAVVAKKFSCQIEFHLQISALLERSSLSALCFLKKSLQDRVGCEAQAGNPERHTASKATERSLLLFADTSSVPYHHIVTGSVKCFHNHQLGCRFTAGSKMSVVGCFGDCGFGSPPTSKDG